MFSLTQRDLYATEHLCPKMNVFAVLFYELNT